MPESWSRDDKAVGLVPSRRHPAQIQGIISALPLQNQAHQKYADPHSASPYTRSNAAFCIKAKQT